MKLKKHERLSLGEYLCEWPSNKTFEEILDLVEASDDSIVVWEPLEDYPLGELRELIEDTSCNLKETYGDF